MRHVKRFGAVIALVVLVSLAIAVPRVSAHVLESDNGVSAILHIVPADRPVAAKAVPINFLFSNDVGGFKLSDYKVSLRLLEHKTVKFSGTVDPKFFGSATEGELTATFPSAGLYTVELKGVPVRPNAPAFRLLFSDVRVAEKVGAANTGKGIASVIVSLFSVVILVMVAVKAISGGGKYRRIPKSK